MRIDTTCASDIMLNDADWLPCSHVVQMLCSHGEPDMHQRQLRSRQIFSCHHLGAYHIDRLMLIEPRVSVSLLPCMHL